MFSYGLNNPMYWVDPDGLRVRNYSPFPVPIKPENGSWFLLPPGHEWSGSPDGWQECGGKIMKVDGKWYTPPNDIIIGEDGKGRCLAGTCTLRGPFDADAETLDSPTWKVPGDIKPGPDTTPLPSRAPEPNRMVHFAP